MPRMAPMPATRPTRAAILRRLLEATRRVWMALQREHRLRATIHELHGLNDRTLKDIGLQREDIEAVVRDRCHNR